MSVPAPSIRLPHPDRLSIWPTERGYGVDVTWSGPDGYRDAERLTGELKRLGPVSADEARQVVALFVR